MDKRFNWIIDEFKKRKVKYSYSNGSFIIQHNKTKTEYYYFPVSKKWREKGSNKKSKSTGRLTSFLEKEMGYEIVEYAEFRRPQYIPCQEELAKLRGRALEGFRYAIYEQIVEFKKSSFIQSTLICPLTGIEVTIKDCHVDHIKDFSIIVKEFLDQEELSIYQCKARKINRNFKELEDENLARRFSDYHKKVAELRIVSSQGNLSRSKTRIDWGECSAAYL
jgi:hypothetical protein